MPAAGRLSLRVSNPDKVYWPDDGYTKLDLVEYYRTVFPRLRPWVQDRMFVLKRCPYGMLGRCFYQKEKPDSMPPGTPTRRIVHTNGIRNYVVGGKLETQLALANLGCIEVHIWGSRAQHPRQPDWVCFDLDPSSGRFADAIGAARRVKDALDALGLRSYPKTSGQKGLHVFVPIRVGPDVDEVRGFAETLGHLLARSFPDELTMEFPLANRGGRVYLDPARNGFSQSVAAPWSVRRRPHAPVSVCLEWSEVRPTLDTSAFTMGNVGALLRRKDPWAGFFRRRQDLRPALRAVARM